MKRKSLIVLAILLLSFYITLLKIDSVVAQPNPQKYYYEENVTVRVNANNDSLNEIRFQGTNLTITGLSEPENLFHEAFKDATYALLSVEREDYNFDAYGNTFLYQQDDGIILSIAYANLTENKAKERADLAKDMFEDAFNITLDEGTSTYEPVTIEASNYSIFTFINNVPHFDDIFGKFWTNATGVRSGFVGLLNDTFLRETIIKETSNYAKIVMGFVNKTRPQVGKLREVFFSVEYLDDDIVNLSTGNNTFSMNELFHHTGTDISRYNPSNSSTIDVYLPTPLEPNVIEPDLSKFYDPWSITNGSISLTLHNNNVSITNLIANFTVEGWPCLLVEKSISSIKDSYSPDDTFEVEVSITNIGNGNARNVTIDDYGQWDADLELADDMNVTETKGDWPLIEPDYTKTIDYKLHVKNTAQKNSFLLLKNSTVEYNFSSAYVPATTVQLNATSNTAVVPIEMDFPSLITTKTVTRAVYSTGERIDVTIIISNPSDLGVHNNVTVSEYIPGGFDNSSISNNTSILSSQYESGGYWVHFTLEGPSDHSSISFSYVFYPLNLDSGILYLNQSKIAYSFGENDTTTNSNSLTLLLYQQLIQDAFHHHVKVEADFDSIVNPETTMTVNVTITNFGNSPEQYRVINRNISQFQELNQTSGNNNFNVTLAPGQSHTFNYTYSISDMEGDDFVYPAILVVSNVSTSLDPVIALSDVENIHINSGPTVKSVSFNATKLNRVMETIEVQAECSDHGETPRAQLTVVLRINNSAGQLFNRSMTFDETTNLFVGNFTPSASARTGTHTFRIFVTDEHDLTGRSSYYNFTVKNTKPKVTWMELYSTNVTLGDTIKGAMVVKEVETPLFNLNVSLYCQSQNVSVVYYGTLSLFESRLVDQYNRVGTFDIEIDTSNWREGTYDVYVTIEDDVSSIDYYYGEIIVRKYDSPFWADENLLLGLAYNIGVVLFLIFQFRGLTLLIKREFPF